MKNIIWLTANRFGYEMIKEGMKAQANHTIVTLSDEATTVMYDKVGIDEFIGLGIPVVTLNDINKESHKIEALKPDVVIMCGWRQIVNPEVLAIPKDYFIGFHPTLLPKGRGCAPIINSIMSNFSNSGLTMYHVNERVDAGDIIGQENFTIYSSDYAMDVYFKMILAGRKLIKKYLPIAINGKLPRIRQNEDDATYFSELPDDFNRIHMGESVPYMHKKIRALSHPYLGAYIEHDGRKLVIWRADMS